MKRLPTMKQLQYLTALAAARHFGRAAKRCNVSQSTLSAGIRDLEEVLGTAVAERSNRHVLITRAGIKIADKARAVLQEAEGIMDAAQADRSPMTGDMHLGAIPTISPFFLPRVLPELRVRFPELTIYLREEKTASLLARLDEGGLDVVLIALPYDTGDLRVDVIMDDEFLFACNLDHALAGTDEVSLESLAGEQLMLLEEGHCLRGHTLEICGIGDKRARAQFEGSSLHALVQMVAAGIGVTIIPRLAVDAHVTRAAGISLSRLTVPASRQIGLAWRRSSSRNRDMRMLADALRAMVGQA